MSRSLRTALSLCLAALALSAAPGTIHAQEETTGIWINGVELDAPTVRSLEQQLGIRAVPGAYWYDALSGLYGTIGGPGLGFTAPGLEIGGRLAADASGGGTSVFVNARELHPSDVAVLMALLGTVYPGRYWLRWDGYYGFEGGPPIGNLIYIARQASGGAGYNRTTYGGHLGSDGQTSYFFDRDSGCSVISGGGVSC